MPGAAWGGHRVAGFSAPSAPTGFMFAAGMVARRGCVKRRCVCVCIQWRELDQTK